jgi:hypothetical protein
LIFWCCNDWAIIPFILRILNLWQINLLVWINFLDGLIRQIVIRFCKLSVCMISAESRYSCIVCRVVSGIQLILHLRIICKSCLLSHILIAFRLPIIIQRFYNYRCITFFKILFPNGNSRSIETVYLPLIQICFFYFFQIWWA